MHIALTDNESICSKCESVMKENNPPDTKLIKEKSQATPLSRYQKTFSKSRQSKSKLRCTFGNQHRLDHTYAAAINFNEVVPSTSNEQSTKKAPISKESSSQKLQSHSVLCEKQNSIIDNNYRTNDKVTDSEQSSPSSSNDEISLKSSWLRNLFHLEYQPTKNIDKLEAEQLDDALREKRSSPRLSGNGLLKQYQRNSKNSKSTAEQSSSKFEKNKTIISPEDEKRWIAATALLQLSSGFE